MQSRGVDRTNQLMSYAEWRTACSASLSQSMAMRSIVSFAFCLKNATPASGALEAFADRFDLALAHLGRLDVEPVVRVAAAVAGQRLLGDEVLAAGGDGRIVERLPCSAATCST